MHTHTIQTQNTSSCTQMEAVVSTCTGRQHISPSQERFTQTQMSLVLHANVLPFIHIQLETKTWEANKYFIPEFNTQKSVHT